MCQLMQDKNGYNLQQIGYQIAIPKVLRSIMEKQQKYRNDGKRERKGYEKGHAVLLIQFIHNHDEIDVTERYETDGKNPEHMIALGYHFRTVCPESPGNHSRERQISRQVTAIETVIKRKDFLRIKLKA